MDSNILDEEIALPSLYKERHINELRHKWLDRRITYNKVVGITGISFIALDFMISPQGAMIAAVLAMIYAVMANVCFTLGIFTEGGVLLAYGDFPSLKKYGDIMYAAGFIFSMLLTIVVGIISTMICAEGLF